MKKIYSFVAIFMLIAILLTSVCSCSKNEETPESDNNFEFEDSTKPVVNNKPAKTEPIETEPVEKVYTLLATDWYYRDIKNIDIKKAAEKQSGLNEKVLDRYTVTVYVEESTGEFKCTVRTISEYLNEELDNALKTSNFKKAQEIINNIIAEQDRNFVNIETE